MYTVIDFPTKKALREAIASRAVPSVNTYQPGPFKATENGRVTLEGPHYPKAHTWYASAVIQNGRIVPGSLK
jgi:hypothetical protein